MAKRLTADLEAYLAELAAVRAPNTVRRYRVLLRRVLRQLPSETDWDNLRPGELRKALEAAYGGHAFGTYATAIAALRGFCRWAYRVGRLPTPGLVYLLPRAPYRSLPRALTRSEEEAFVRWVFASPSRWRTAFLLLLRGGLRRSEVRTFVPERWEGQILWGRVAGRRGRVRTVAVLPVSAGEVELLRHYVPEGCDKPPFPYAPQWLSVGLCIVSEALGIRITATALRYTYAIRLLRAGVSADTVLHLTGLARETLKRIRYRKTRRRSLRLVAPAGA